MKLQSFDGMLYSQSNDECCDVEVKPQKCMFDFATLTEPNIASHNDSGDLCGEYSQEGVMILFHHPLRV